MSIKKTTIVFVFLINFLSTSIYAVPVPRSPADFPCLIATLVTAAPTAAVTGIMATKKGNTVSELEAQKGSIEASYRNATNLASAKRSQIAQTRTNIGDLNCILEREPDFQHYARQHCSEELFSNISDQITFLSGNYSLYFNTALDYTTRNLENVYRTELYQVSEAYNCDVCTSHGFDGTCLRYRSATCYKTVTRTRQVVDYQRIIDRTYVQSGTSIQGQNQNQISCSSNSQLSFISNSEQIDNTWDRNDATHYYNKIYLTTALNFLAMTQGTVIQTGKSIVDKNSTYSQTANQLINFIRDQCQSAYPRLAWNRTATEQNKAAYQGLLETYESELPNLETEERSKGVTLNNILKNILGAKSDYTHATGLAIGLSFGLPIAAASIVAIIYSCFGLTAQFTWAEPNPCRQEMNQHV